MVKQSNIFKSMIEYLNKNNKKYKISIKIDLNENIHNEQGVFVT